MAETQAKTPPGPKGRPIFGHTLEAWKDPLRFMFDSVRDYGDIVRFAFGPYEYVMINHPDAVHHVLVENAKNYTKSRNYDGLKLVLGHGLVTSEGETWKRQRRLAQPAFHRDRLASFARTMAAEAEVTANEWDAKVGEPLDVSAEMMRLTFRIVGRTLFSVDLESDAQRLGPAIVEAMHFADAYASSVFRLPMWLPLPKIRSFRRAVSELDDLVLRIIAERRAAKDGEHDDLLDMLMRAQDEATREGMSDRQLRDEVMTLVLAGHETTANLLTWTFCLLSQHPEIARRVRDEALAVTGGRPATLEDVPRLKLVSMVLQESMRLLPPVWAFERQAIEEDAVMGFRVPARAIVGISPYCLHRHPRYWENPEGFDPERFAPERAQSRPRYAYMPFGGGPRQCIGNNFALMEGQIILATLASRFRVDLAPGETIDPEPTVTLRPRRGVRVTVARAGAADREPRADRYVARSLRDSASASRS
jgi:cytochrome P450